MTNLTGDEVKEAAKLLDAKPWRANQLGAKLMEPLRTNLAPPECAPGTRKQFLTPLESLDIWQRVSLQRRQGS